MDLILHDLPASVIEQDIRRFLEYKLIAIGIHLVLVASQGTVTLPWLARE